MKLNRITFDPSAKDFILRSFKKVVGKDGYLKEVDNPHQPVLAPDGTEIRSEDFAGIRKGSEIFIKSDFISLIELSDETKDNAESS